MKRISQLDGLRAIAILAVFVHHALHVKLLWMGVDLFFVLSGFLITGVLLNAKEHRLREYISHFYTRRVRRIVAPYVLALAFLSLFVGIAWLRHWYFFLGLTNFLKPLRIDSPKAFEPLWSLAVEEQFYFVWPFAVYFLNPRQLTKLTCFLIFVAPLLRSAFHFQTHWAIYMLTPFRMDLLAMGALLCVVYRQRKQWMQRFGMLCAAIFGVVGIGGLLGLAKLQISTYGNTRVANALVYEFTLFVATAMMLWALSGRAVGFLNLSPVRYIGQISYSMYLIHFGVLLLLASRFSAQKAALLGLGITLVYASASWYGMEKPLLAAKRFPAHSVKPTHIVFDEAVPSKPQPENVPTS